jgi:hypothetical protein
MNADRQLFGLSFLRIVQSRQNSASHPLPVWFENQKLLENIFLLLVKFNPMIQD